MTLPPAFAALGAYRRFVTYALEPDPDRPGKTIKRPTDVHTGRYCKATDPAHQYTHAEANATGRPVGFVFDRADGFAFLDIDNCLIDTPGGPQLSPLATELRQRLAGAAVEISQSGRGLHIIARASIAAHSCKNVALGIELYTNARFAALTFTGATGEAGADLGAAFNSVAVTYFPPNPLSEVSGWTFEPVAGWEGPADDEALLHKAKASRSAGSAFGDKASVADLWNADADALARAFPGANGGHDASSADMALAWHLAYWTGKDCERVRSLMLRSGLARPKWDDRPEYLETTIVKACALNPGVYQGGKDDGGSGEATIAAGAPHLHGPQSSRVELVRGDTIRVEPIDWLWPGWLAAGKLHILAGKPGTGKTTIALDLAATVTRGGKWPDGCRAEQGSVVIWSGEDDPADTLAPRLIAAGAEMPRVHMVKGVRDGPGGLRPFNPASDTPELAAALAGVPDVRLLIVDPVVSAVAGDSHKNAEVRRGLQPLVDLAQSHRCALIGVTHFTKGTAGSDPLDRVTGSLAFGALARLVLVTAKADAKAGEEAHRFLARAKSNIGPDGGGFAYDLRQGALVDFADIVASSVHWGTLLEGTARELLADAEQEGDEADERRGAADWLRETLSGGPLPAKEVRRQADEAGFAWRTMQRAMQRAGIISKREGFSASASWRLPSGATETASAPSAPTNLRGVNGVNGSGGGQANTDRYPGAKA